MQQSGTTEVHIVIEHKFKVFGDKKLIRDFSDEGKNFKS